MAIIMKKKICAVLLIVCVSSLLCSCYMEDVYDKPDKVTNVSCDFIHDWVDPDTGIHYLLSSFDDGDYITPRLNSDGTVMGAKQTKKTKQKVKGDKKNEKTKSLD